MPLPDKFVVTGTPEQIATQLPLLQALYLMMKDTQSSNGGGAGRLPVSPDFDDWLQLTIVWHGVTEITLKSHRVEKSVRIKSVNPRTVTLTYLQDLAKRTKAKFNGLTWKTGRCKCKYTKWKDGIQSWGYFESVQTGYKIIESLGDLIEKPIEQKLFKYEYALNPEEAFDPTPSKISVANKSVRPRAKAPIATMNFSHALITFPWINHTEKLCAMPDYTIKDLSFLDAYDD